MTRERPKDEPNSLLCDLQHRPARQRGARLSVRAAERPPSLRSPRLSAVRKRGRCHSPRAAVPHPRFHSRTNMLKSILVAAVLFTIATPVYATSHPVRLGTQQAAPALDANGNRVDRSR